jgi:hypothetical protein
MRCEGSLLFIATPPGPDAVQEAEVDGREVLDDLGVDAPAALEGLADDAPDAADGKEPVAVHADLPRPVVEHHAVVA